MPLTVILQKHQCRKSPRKAEGLFQLTETKRRWHKIPSMVMEFGLGEIFGKGHFKDY
jgi:hypothetical protein